MAIKVELVASQSNTMHEYPREVAVGMELSEALTAPELAIRLIDLNKALMSLLTYSPDSIRDAFEGE